MQRGGFDHFIANEKLSKNKEILETTEVHNTAGGRVLPIMYNIYSNRCFQHRLQIECLFDVFICSIEITE